MVVVFSKMKHDSRLSKYLLLEVCIVRYRYGLQMKCLQGPLFIEKSASELLFLELCLEEPQTLDINCDAAIPLLDTHAKELRTGAPARTWTHGS